MRVAQRVPFLGKFSVLIQKRHEITCKCRFAPGRFRTDDGCQRDIYNAERFCIFHRGVLQDLVQCLQIRVSPFQHARPELFLSKAERLAVIFLCHIHCLLLCWSLFFILSFLMWECNYFLLHLAARLAQVLKK